MDITISSTEAARHLGDVLAKIKHTGQSFLLTKSSKPLARIVPVDTRAGGTGAEINRVLSGLPCDPSFADDLERVNRLDSIPANPWA
jgi:prevent-host-death family protein